MTLLQTMRKVPEDQMAWLGRVYLQPSTLPTRRAQILDALIEHGSPAAQQAVIQQVRWSHLDTMHAATMTIANLPMWLPPLTRQVLLSDAPLMADLNRALVGLATMQAAPISALVAVLEELVFEPKNMSLRCQSQAIRVQAMLTLGSLVRRF